MDCGLDMVPCVLSNHVDSRWDLTQRDEGCTGTGKEISSYDDDLKMVPLHTFQSTLRPTHTSSSALSFFLDEHHLVSPRLGSLQALRFIFPWLLLSKIASRTRVGEG